MIEVDQPGLRARQQQIRTLLKPIAAFTVGIQFRPQSQAVLLGVAHGSPPSGDHRSWRFNTIVPTMKANYFEVWSSSGHDRWVLKCAYLTLFTMAARGEEREYISLHCDPAENLSYKRGPHLHVCCSTSPMPRAHLALNLGHLSEVLESLSNLMSAMRSGVQLVKDEVLTRLDGQV